MRETFRSARKTTAPNLGEIEELTMEEQSMADEIEERRKTSKGSAAPSSRRRSMGSAGTSSRKGSKGSEAPSCETCSSPKTEVVKKICLEGGRESIVAA